MSLTNRALFAIERNLQQDLSLAEIAKTCDVSRFHLAHAFGEATGLAVMEYVHGRRLTEAAYALVSGASGILDVALDYGYGSHESFTRAFKAHFDRTPEDVRRARSLVNLALVDAIRFVEGAGARLEPPRIEREGEIKFVGLAQPFTYGHTAHLPNQWRQFMMQFYPRIERKSVPIPVGVVTGENDAVDEFQYACAAQVSSFGVVPEGLVTLTLAPATYAVFPHNRHITELQHSYAAIWNEWLPESGKSPAEAPSFERHNPTFGSRTGEGGVTIWIALVE